MGSTIFSESPNDESTKVADELRADLVRLLKEFPLSYEQHQILHKPGIGMLVQSLLRKRRRFTIALGLLTATCFAFAIRGVAFSSVYLPWTITAAVLGFWTYRRVQRSNLLSDAFHRFEQSRLDQREQRISLGDALRLSFSLDYDEHQAIHQGDDQLVADQMIDRFNKYSATLALGGAGAALSAWNRVGIHSLPFIIVLAVGVAACACRNWLQVQRVKKIVGEHSEATIANEKDPLQVLAEEFSNEVQSSS